MVYRRSVCVGGSVASLILLLQLGSHLDGETFRSYPGKVVDGKNKKPTGAEVIAYPIAGQTGGQDCRPYGQAWARKAADPTTGEFVLQINETQRAFLAVFCRSEYYPRTEPQDNPGDGSLIQPYPTEIWRRDVSQEIFREAIHRSVLRMLADLRYFRSSRPEALVETLENWQKETKDPALQQLLPPLLSLSRQRVARRTDK